MPYYWFRVGDVLARTFGEDAVKGCQKYWALSLPTVTTRRQNRNWPAFPHHFLKILICPIGKRGNVFWAIFAISWRTRQTHQEPIVKEVLPNLVTPGVAM